jgi:ADP-heptose:LPS heptosyltransferase
LARRTGFGFPRVHSRIFLTRPLVRPEPSAHRYEFWRVLARALGLELPPREKISIPAGRGGRTVLIHTGAGQRVRVWPLEKYKNLAAHLRQKNFLVQIACDPDQRAWWQGAGETEMATPENVTELIALD